MRQRLLAVGEGSRLEPALFLMVSQQFTNAKLDPGLEFRALMESLMEKTAGTVMSSDGGGRLDMHLDTLARQVGSDPFDFHTEVHTTADAFAEEHRAAMECNSTCQTL